MELIRIWQEVNIKNIENQLIIVDDIQGFCPGCKQTGITYEKIDTCPQCKRIFKYITTRENPLSSKGKQILTKIRQTLPGLTIIDYSDYKHIIDNKKAHDLFNN